MTGVSETIHTHYLTIPRHGRADTPVIADSPIIASPIYTLDLPEPVGRWLADAGISMRTLGRSDIRRGLASAADRPALLLYDSRNASDRTDAEAAAAMGYKTIDTARLLAGHRQGHSDQTILMSAEPRRRFLDALRPEIEASGAAWLRLADFPHPYRGAICRQAGHAVRNRLLGDPGTARLAHTVAEISGTDDAGSGMAVEECLRASQQAGQPVSIAGPLETGGLARRIDMAIAPLTWETTLEVFAIWWRRRQAWTVTAIGHDRAMDISLETNGPSTADSWTPAVEIWRGRHVAILPLHEGTITIRDQTLPYQHEPFRHHAGFTADETGLETSGPPIPLMSAAS